MNDLQITLQHLNREPYSLRGVQTSHFLEEGSLKHKGGHPPVLFVGRLLFKSYGRAGFFMPKTDRRTKVRGSKGGLMFRRPGA